MNRALFLFATLLLTIIGWLAYFPGLTGTFLFDDFNNLAQIGAYGKVNNLRSLILYLTSGNADPIGRPLSLLSFLLDANDWPADPKAFKRTNILLHLLNGVLLCWTLLRLGARLGVEERRRGLVAVLGAALWALHPLFVSTTLYVVQREAILPATLTLVGANFWLSGKSRWLSGKPGGWILLIFAAWGCTALAVLCKANGILLPLLLLVMEWTLPDRAHTQSEELRFRTPQTLLLGIPTSILALWLLSKIPAVFRGETFGRPWTIGQRLLTEGRVVCDYLQQLLIPRATGTSIFNDGYIASTGPLHPWSTLPCLLLVSALIILGIRLRHSHPVLAFSILFYCAGQVLESTVVPLELYFEHRNYLPAMMLFWPLALWLIGPGPLLILRTALAVLLPCLLAALCHARAEIWGRPYLQATLLANLDPDSPRAQANAANYETRGGRPDIATAQLRVALAKAPDETQLALNLIDSECAMGGVSLPTLEHVRYALVHNREQAQFVQNWLVDHVEFARGQACPGLTSDEFDRLIAAYQQNPQYSKGPGHQLDLWQLKGRVALQRKDAATALDDFNNGLRQFATPDAAMLQAALLGSAGYPTEGLVHLQFFATLAPANRGLHAMPALHLWLLNYYHYWDEELTHLRSQLQIDSEAQAAGSSRHVVQHP